MDIASLADRAVSVRQPDGYSFGQPNTTGKTYRIIGYSFACQPNTTDTPTSGRQPDIRHHTPRGEWLGQRRHCHIGRQPWTRLQGTRIFQMTAVTVDAGERGAQHRCFHKSFSRDRFSRGDFSPRGACWWRHGSIRKPHWWHGW